jgi:hypothetical protein
MFVRNLQNQINNLTVNPSQPSTQKNYDQVIEQLFERFNSVESDIELIKQEIQRWVKDV